MTMTDLLRVTAPLLAVVAAPELSAQFGTPQELTGTTGGSIAPTLVDLDGDGRLDVVTGDYGPMGWRRNQGSTFGTVHLFGGDCPGMREFRVTDLDGDGTMDVVRVSTTVGVNWLPGLGGGHFGPAQNITTALLPWDIAAVDLDLDGDTDLVLASGGLHGLQVIENLGSGSFGPPQPLAQAVYGARAVEVGDLDGDGLPDLVYSSESVEQVDWIRNLGAFAFGATSAVGQGLRFVADIELEDMDGDGDLEIVAAAGGSNRIVWFENQGSGTFGAEQLLSPRPSPFQIEFVDVDGDQDRDLMVTFGSSTGLGWLERTSVGTYLFPRRIVPQGWASGLSTGDVDADGRVDVLASTQFDGLAWYPGAATPTAFGPPRHFHDLVQEARDIVARDIDGDGDTDIIAASLDDDQIALFENLGAGTFGRMERIDRDCDECNRVRAEDVDLDGDVDLVYASAGSREVYVKHNTGGAFGPRQTIVTLNTEAYGLELVDLDGDSDRDLIVLDDRVHVLENVHGSFVPRALLSGLNFPRALEVGDIDGDGLQDLLALSRNDLSIKASSNLGGLSFSPMTTISPTGSIPLDFAIGDPDGDGDLDLVTIGGWDNYLVRLYRNNGQGAFSPAVIVDQTTFNAEREHIRFSDLDNDGDDDIVLHLSDTSTAGGVFWYESFPASFGPQQLVTDLEQKPSAGTEADMDGDGDLDLIVAAEFGNTVHWVPSHLRSTIGTDTCGPGALNSTGRAGVLYAIGSSVAADDQLSLRVRALPSQQFGLFATAMASTAPTAIPGSMGLLCLGGTVGRIQGPGQIIQTSLAGTAHLDIGTNALPLGGQFFQAATGETWHFQFWHRDVMGGATSNLTNAVGVTFL